MTLVADVDVVEVVGQPERRAREVEKRDHLLRLEDAGEGEDLVDRSLRDAAGLLVAENRDAA